MSESKTPESDNRKSQYPFHRRFVRYSIRLWIIVRSDEEHDAWTQNISQDGVCFELPNKLEEGQAVRLFVHLREKPPQRPIKCECRIVWNEEVEGGYIHGGQFGTFEDSGLERLTAYLEKSV